MISDRKSKADGGPGPPVKAGACMHHVTCNCSSISPTDKVPVWAEAAATQTKRRQPATSARPVRDDSINREAIDGGNWGKRGYQEGQQSVQRRPHSIDSPLIALASGPLSNLIGPSETNMPRPADGVGGQRCKHLKKVSITG